MTGLGLHTGEKVLLRFSPAKEGTGIIFRKIEGKDLVEIPAKVSYVQDTARSTNIGLGSKKIYTIEHVLAALRASNIDNLYVDVQGSEPPVGDGSSLPYLEMIEKAGIHEQSANRSEFVLRSPVYYSEGEVHLVALPCDHYQISYTLHYPQAESVTAQYHSVRVDQETFRKEIAPCRTFSLYQEISYLIDRGLIKGGSLDNAIVIMDDVILSKEGLRFENEMARHKILDLIGDLSLIGIHLKAHIIAVRSGHSSNVAFAQKLLQHISTEAA